MARTAPIDRLADARDRAAGLTGRQDSYLTPERVDEFLASQEWELSTFLDLLETHALERPSDISIIEADGSAMSFGELAERCRLFGSALVELGYKPGDTLGVQLPNWSEFAWVVLGAASVGVHPVFIHTPYRSFEMEYILSLCQAKGVVVPQSYRGYDHLKLATDLRARVTTLEDVFVARPEEPIDLCGAISLPELLGQRAGTASGVPLPWHPASTDLFVIMFTSGTTNRPKGVMHLHANLLNACRKYVDSFGLTSEDRWLIVTPLTHLTAFGIAFLAGGLAAGSSLVLLESWEPEAALELAETYHVTHFVGAPPMLIDISRSPDLLSRDLSSLRFLMYAGAPCPIEILRRLHDRLGCALAVFYGWTEGLAHTYSLPEDPLEITSVTIGRTGKGWQSRVVGETGQDVGPGEQGEFWGKGPNLSPGYFHQPQFMAARYHPEGWFMSGDIVTANQDGTFTFVARKDDVINRGGQKIDPREVEEVLYQLRDIADAVVVAMPDARLGSRACAFIVPAQDRDIDLPKIQAHLAAAGLAKYKWPEHVEIISSLPMTPTGKIMRYELRRRAEELTAT